MNNLTPKETDVRDENGLDLTKFVNMANPGRGVHYGAKTPRKVVIDNKSYLDYTANCYFGSFCMPHVDDKVQIDRDIDSYIKDVEIKTFSPEELKLTEWFRQQSSDFGRTFSMAKLTKKPFKVYNGPALMLPQDNKLGVDYLTTRHPLYKRFMYDLYDTLVKTATDVEVETYNEMLTDWYAPQPYPVMVYVGERSRVKPGAWKDEDLKLYSRLLDQLLLREFENANIEECRPNMNVSKGTGFNTLDTDGRVVRISEEMYVPAYYCIAGHVSQCSLVRRDTSARRVAFEPVILENIEFALADKDFCLIPSSLNSAFQREGIAVHTGGRRINCPDPFINEVSGSVSSLDGKFYTKERKAAYDYVDKDGHIKIKEFVYDKEKMSKMLFARSHGDISLVPNNMRAINTETSMSYTVGFQALFKFLLKRLEDGPTSFPSLRKAYLNRCARNFAITDGMATVIIQSDRTNFEQFISDNWHDLKRMLPGWLAYILDRSSVSINAGFSGPWYSNGGLFSGTAATSAIAILVGLFETINLFVQVTGVPFVKLAPLIVNCIFEQTDGFWLGDFYLAPTLGTDDQVYYIFNKRMSQEVFYDYVKNKLADFGDDRSLKVNVTTDTTGFGLHFTTTAVEVNEALGLSKLWLSEKTMNGDRIALKYHCRLQLQQKWIDTIQGLFVKYGFGSLTEYSIGANKAAEQIERFGWGPQDIYNSYNPGDNIAIAEYLVTHGVDPIKGDRRYSLEFTQNLYKLFGKYIPSKNSIYSRR